MKRPSQPGAHLLRCRGSGKARRSAPDVVLAVLRRGRHRPRTGRIRRCLRPLHVRPTPGDSNRRWSSPRAELELVQKEPYSFTSRFQRTQPPEALPLICAAGTGKPSPALPRPAWSRVAPPGQACAARSPIDSLKCSSVRRFRHESPSSAGCFAGSEDGRGVAQLRAG